MNVDLDLSGVSRFLRGVLNELHQKRLWPVAAAILAAIVAVPVLLSKSSTPPPVAQAPVPTPPAAPGATLPALGVRAAPAPSKLRGAGHDPFSEGVAVPGPAGAPSTAAGAPSAAAGAATSPAPGTGEGSAASSGAGVGGTVGVGSGSASTTPGAPATAPRASSGNPPSITPNAKPKPAPSGLTPTQHYDVSLTATNSSGGLVTTDPQQRLSMIPSQRQPLLVELGVLQGGSRVLFAVQPGTELSGPGSCIPGPIDCEILSLAQDQTESVASRSAGGAQPTLFAVTGITAANAPTADAAASARRSEAAAGRALLDKSASSALALFQYEPGLGAVVDERNLTVGGTS